MQTESLIGARIVCAETGKAFTGAADGITTNYATTSAGEILSDEGVDIRECRGLLERSKPFYCYVSCDGRWITGWKGNKLGSITAASSGRLTRQSFTHGRTIQAYRVTDVHGGHWYGRGNPGICITLRACK